MKIVNRICLCISNFKINKCGGQVDVLWDEKKVVGHLVNVFIKKPVCAPAVYAGQNKAQGRPRERQAGATSSVISFHHYLVTNIVWALNSILIKTVYVMCKIYLGVGVPLWGIGSALDDLFLIWRQHFGLSYYSWTFPQERRLFRYY